MLSLHLQNALIMAKQGIGQEQQLAQKQIASQQTVQLMRMVEMDNASIEQEIRKAADENPALEIDRSDEEDNEMMGHDHAYNDNEDHTQEIDQTRSEDPFDNEFYADDEREDIAEYRLYSNNHSADDVTRERVIVVDQSLQEQLMQQLGELDISDRDYEICEYIIGNLDDNGYLQRDSQALANELLFSYNISISTEKLEGYIVNIIQELDPAGIGARSLQECLQIQLKRKKQTLSVRTALEIITKHFDLFVKKHYDKLMKQLNINESVLKEALSEIKKTDPHPASNDSFIENNTATIIPDFIIQNQDGHLDLSLNKTYIPKLKINSDFAQDYPFLSQEKNDQLRRDAEKFLKENLDNANAYINLLSLREKILYNTMLAIMNKQKLYFSSGNESDLKPMVLKDIAEQVNLDISTISRVSSSKYVQTPFGIILLKNLFSEAVGDEDISSKAIKKILSDVIANEDKANPLPDEQLCVILQEKGYNIARRTVAKYREQLGLPVARLRKEIQL